MYVIIGSTTYTSITNLVFEPETDVTGSEVPVNELTVDVETQNSVVVGTRISLYDDSDELWAKYWVIFAERVDERTIRVRGQSAVKQLERDMLDPVMCSSTSVATILATTLDRLDGEYVLDSSFANETITGYLPKQTARNRLQWVCLAIGAYVKDFFGDKLEILPVDTEGDELIPADVTFWKPKITYDDYVTAVQAVYYSYAQGTPTSTDTWVEANGVTYIQTETQVTLRNANVPPTALEHVIRLGGVTIVNQGNVDDILSSMAAYRFKRMRLELDLIDNGEWYPGMRVTAFALRDTLATGYINTCSFRFGQQARARVRMTPVEVRDSALLRINYKWGDVQIGYREFRLPVGHQFSMANPYIELDMDGHHYVFRPLTQSVTVTIVSGGNTLTQYVEPALDLNKGLLHVISVDGVTASDGTAVIE